MEICVKLLVVCYIVLLALVADRNLVCQAEEDDNSSFDTISSGKDPSNSSPTTTVIEISEADTTTITESLSEQKSSPTATITTPDQSTTADPSPTTSAKTKTDPPTTTSATDPLTTTSAKTKTDPPTTTSPTDPPTTTSAKTKTDPPTTTSATDQPTTKAATDPPTTSTATTTTTATTPPPKLGERCESNETDPCSETNSNAICVNNSCNCKCGWYPDETNICVEYRFENIGDPQVTDNSTTSLNVTWYGVTLPNKTNRCYSISLKRVNKKQHEDILTTSPHTITYSRDDIVCKDNTHLSDSEKLETNFHRNNLEQKRIKRTSDFDDIPEPAFQRSPAGSSDLQVPDDVGDGETKETPIDPPRSGRHETNDAGGEISNEMDSYWTHISKLTPGAVYEMFISLHVPCEYRDEWMWNYTTVTLRTDPAMPADCRYSSENDGINITYHKKPNGIFDSCVASVDRLDENGHFDERLSSMDFDCTTLKVANLSSGINYNITAQTKSGSLISKERVCSINVPASKPTAVQNMSIIKTEIVGKYQLTWNPPVEPNGYIKFYAVVELTHEDEGENICHYLLNSSLILKEEDYDLCGKHCISKYSPRCPDTKKDQLTLIPSSHSDAIGLLFNLTPDQSYEFSVTAINQNYRGQVENTSFVPDAYEPSKPNISQAEAKNNTAANLRWTKPSPYPGKTNYTVRVFKCDFSESNFEQTITITGYSNTTCIVTGLASSTVYVFEVVAITSSGKSESVKSDPIRTWKDNPSEVQNVKVTKSQDLLQGQYLMTWKPPLRPSGSIEIYDVIILKADDKGDYGCWKHYLLYPHPISDDAIDNQCKKQLCHSQLSEDCPEPQGKSIELTSDKSGVVGPVVDLTPDVKYKFSVIAINRSYRGDEVATINFTPESYKPNTPAITSVEVKSNTVIYLNWTKPSPYPGKTNYTMRVYKAPAYKSNVERTIAVNGYSNTSYCVAGLISNTLYIFEVVAKTSSGESEPVVSNQTNTWRDNPDEVKNLLVEEKTQCSINLQWHRPENINGEGILMGYIVLVRHNASGGTSSDDTPNCLDAIVIGNEIKPSFRNGVDFCKIPEVYTTIEEKQWNKDIITFEIIHLKPYVNYDIRVAAFNNFGLGDPHTITERTEVAKPSRVLQLNITKSKSHDPGEHKISWKPPLDPNGVIEFYNVIILNKKSNNEKYATDKCSLLDGISEIRRENICDGKEDGDISLDCYTRRIDANTDNDAVVDILQELIPDMPYIISVTASNQKYRGDAETTCFVPISYKPSNVEYLTAETESNTAISVTWAKPATYPGKTNYTMTVCNTDGDGSDPEQVINVIGYNNTTYLVTGLTANTSYVFEIMAITSSGKSQPIKSDSTRTWKDTPDEVQNLHVEDKTAYSMKIQWNVPTMINGKGELKGYIVYVRRHPIDSDEKITKPRCVKKYIVVSDEEAKIIGMDTSSFCDESHVEREMTTLNFDRESSTLDIIDLDPYVNYDIQVMALNSFGVGVPSEITNNTDVGTPFPITDNIDCNYPEGGLRIEWQSPSTSTGPIKYSIKVQESKHPFDTTDGYVDEEHNNEMYETYDQVSKVRPSWTYKVTITTETSAGKGKSITKECLTPSTEPGPVTTLDAQLVPGNPSIINVTWECPEVTERHGRIEKFVISTIPKESLRKDIPTNSLAQSTTNILMKDLDQGCGSVYNKLIKVVPQVFYTLQIKVKVNDVDELGTSKSKNFSTESSRPPPLTIDGLSEFKAIKLDKRDKSTERSFDVELCIRCIMDNSNGEIVSAGVIVCPSSGCDKVSLKKSTDLENWNSARRKDFKIPFCPSDQFWHVIPEENKSKVVTYTVGSGSCDKKSKDFCNGPLPTDTEFMVKAFACTNSGCSQSKAIGPFKTDKENKNDIHPAVLGAIIAIAITIAVIASVVIIRKRKHYKSKSESNEDTERDGNASSSIPLRDIKPHDMQDWVKEERPIIIGQFEQKMRNLSMYDNVLLHREFMELSDLSPDHDASEGLLPDNKSDNRWTNIVPFNHSRVKLNLQEQNERPHDYINANYVPGVHNDKRYIATQGPLQRTIGDFWQMIWEQGVCVIVMLSKFEELDKRTGVMKEKVARYFPDEEESNGYQFGDITVTRTGKVGNASWEIRTIKLCNVKTKKCRFVKHFLFKNWTDHEADINPDELLEFVNLVRQESSASSRPGAPLAVHCSAGVGRTGTFLAVDYLNEYLDHVCVTADDENEFLLKPVDIFGTVINMRNYRKMMVQTKVQYSLVYETASELIRRKMRHFTLDDDLYYNPDESKEEIDDATIYVNASAIAHYKDNGVVDDSSDSATASTNVPAGHAGEESEYDDVEDLRRQSTGHESNRL